MIEVFRKLSKPLVDRLVVRAFRSVVDLQTVPGFEDRFQEVAVGGVAIVFSNHQSQADGIPYSVVSEYLIKLAGKTDGAILRGFATPIARSMATGDQSAELTESFDFVKGGAERMGVFTYPVTREKDVKDYGMSRSDIVAEVRPFEKRLSEGFGIAFFPEGTVQGGRHPQEKDIEDVYGMQEVSENGLIQFFRLAKKHSGKRPFFLPLGLHGSFRFMQSEDGGGKPVRTHKGIWNLVKGAVTLRADLRIQATLGLPVSEEDLINDLGFNWIKDSSSLNRYLMERITPLVPPQARGVYNRDLQVVG